MSEFVIEQVPSPEESFVVVSNDFARGRLPVPLRALERVLLLHLISLSTGWRGGRRQLDAGVMEGREAVSSALRGLEQKGYLRRDKRRDKRGTWHWTWRVTREPVGSPLPSPSPENPSLAATCGNITSPQVAPSPGNPATDNRGIKTEDLTAEDHKKTDLQDGTPVGARAGAQADPRRPIHGQHLVGLDPKALTQKLTAVWSAAVKESGGTLPIQDGGGWDVDGSPLERGKHPIGGRIKEWAEAWRNPTVEALDAVLDQVRGDARLWAERHPERDREAA